jgi:hypothetical protein
MFAEQDEERSREDLKHGGSTLREVRFPDQLVQECLDTQQPTRIPRLRVQYQAEVMQVDCRLIGQDDCYDTSNWRGFTPYSVSPKGFGQELTLANAELGSFMSNITGSASRTQLVDAICNDQERITNKDKTGSGTSTRHLRGCLKLGLGSIQKEDRDVWVLDSSRKRTFNKCTGAEDDLICNTASFKRVCRSTDTRLLRQHHRIEVRKEVRRHSITDSSTTCFGSSSSSESTQHEGTIRTYSGGKECESRRVESCNQANLRMDIASEMGQDDTRPMGPTNDRCLCIKGKYKTTEILATRSGSQCGSTRCIFAAMAKEGFIPTSPMEVDPQGLSKIQGTTSGRSDFSDTVMADPVLVAHGNATSAQEKQANDNLATRKKLGSDRLEVIEKIYREQGLAREAIEVSRQSTRQKTRRLYDIAWNHWCQYCKVENHDPCEYNVQSILSFLVKNKNYSWSQLNIFRSAIQSVFTVVHPT